MDNRNICGMCRWHKRNKNGEWECVNEDSEAYGFETDYDDDCVDFEGNEQK